MRLNLPGSPGGDSRLSEESGMQVLARAKSDLKDYPGSRNRPGPGVKTKRILDEAETCRAPVSRTKAAFP